MPIALRLRLRLDIQLVWFHLTHIFV